MIAVDTNVLVRIVTGDDPAQTRRAAEALEREPVFIARTVWLELVWVLESAYELDRAAVARALKGLLSLPNLAGEDVTLAKDAADLYVNGMDFADAMHLVARPADAAFVTFDDALRRAARKQSVGEVRAP